MAILGVLALLVFGEKKLPGVMRQAGRVMRDVQNTSQSFLREMDRAADVTEVPDIPAEPAESTALKEDELLDVKVAADLADPFLQQLPALRLQARLLIFGQPLEYQVPRGRGQPT